MRAIFSIVLSAFTLSHAAVAADLVPLSEPEGIARLSRAEHKADFGKLMNHYRNQNDRISCGPVVGAIVLNALRYNTEKAPLVDIPAAYLAQMPVDSKTGVKFDPRIHMYTPENFMNAEAEKVKTVSQVYAEPIKGKPDPGLSLAQFAQIFEKAHGLAVRKIPVGDKTTARNFEGFKPLPQAEYEKVVGEMKKNLSEAGNYVVVNFSRKELGQPGTGHFSPVAAYDSKSDSFLVLDVNPFGGPLTWVAAQDLVNAMNTEDSPLEATDENRGLLLISEK